MPTKLKKNSWYGFIALLVLFILFGLYLSMSLGPLAFNINHTSLIFIDSTSFPKFSSHTDAKNGLELFLSENSTIVLQRQFVSVTISENNTLNSENNVSAANIWQVPGLSLGCEGLNPIGLGIFGGYYTFTNLSTISKGSSVPLFSNGLNIVCNSEPSRGWYAFQPSGNLVISANGTSCLPGKPCVSPMGFTLSTNGNSEGVGERDLSLGTYTVIGEDEWGQVILLHFAVSNVGVEAVQAFSGSNQASGPKLFISLINDGNSSIVSLNASLRLESQFSETQEYLFTFPASFYDPLLPGQIVEDSEILSGGGFAVGQEYHLIISEVLESGVNIIYIQSVSISLAP
jgi:hypothetical protein